MAITNYTELLSAVGNWMDRSDLDSIIPDMITLAEQRMWNGDGDLMPLRVREMEQSATRDMVSGTERYGLPNDFLEMRDIYYTRDSQTVDLVYRTPSQLDEHNSDENTGYPRAFTFEGTEIRLRPIPSGTWTLRQVYYKQPSAITASNTENEILTAYPGIYLFGTLAEAEGYVKNDPRIALWEARFQRMVFAANKSSEKARRRGGAHQATTKVGAFRARNI